ncbi:MAG: LysR family transcriptional regulator [Oscillospiraceae bacterium]|nr:LysR family transcriptional regulator [Oscillospiraceae bacterium]
MNTTQISCFLEVARQLSFVRAAEILYSTQPVVSYQIKSLEDELGVKLFTRNNRTVTLTEAGAYLSTRLGPLSRQMEEAVSVAQAIQARERTILMILIRRLTDYSNLSAAIKRFMDEHPKAQVDIYPQSESNTCKLLFSGEVQLAFCYQFEIPPHSKLQFLPLAKVDYYVFASKDHPLAAYKELTLADLHCQKLLLADSELQKNADLISQKELTQHDIQIASISSSFDGMLLMVESGMGFTILPCGGKKRFAHLVKIPLRNFPCATVGLAWNPATAGEPVLSFIAQAKECFKK